MKPSLRRALVLSGVFLAGVAPVLAHPGHDDGHELTWELGHLVAHPVATFVCLAVLAAAGWAGVQVFRRRADLRTQSLRGSQRSRGK